MSKLKILIAISAACLATACTSFEHNSSVAPSAAGGSTLLGVWTSGSVIPSPSSCTDFNWNASEQTANRASGSFTATCAGNLKLAGTAQGTLTGTTVAWEAQGNASAPDLPSCGIKLTGTGEIGTDTIIVRYSGDTCLGPVSGVESLRRR